MEPPCRRDVDNDDDDNLSIQSNYFVHCCEMNPHEQHCYTFYLFFFYKINLQTGGVISNTISL